MSKELLAQAVDLTRAAAPPVVVSSMTLFGFTLPEIVQLLTIVYLLLMIGYVIYKWYKGI